MQKLVGYIILLSILIGIIVGFLFFTAKNTSAPPAAVTTQTPITPTLPPTTDFPKPKNGTTFTDPKSLYAVTYPKDFTLDQQNNGQYTRIYRNGATQKGQTEQYDGIIVSFENIDIGSKTLTKWVDEKIQTTSADGTLQVTKPKEPITLNGNPGFTYTARGLGEATYVFVQKNTTSPHVVGITYLVTDPQHKGYQAEVDQILASLTLLQ